MEDLLRCAVIGCGHLGVFHAQKYAALPGCELVAVVDIDHNKALQTASHYGGEALQDYSVLLGNIDAVSVVVPTNAHYQVASDFINSGVHVLVEKPMTTTIDEADQLIAQADRTNVILQVGHLERFNAALLGLELDNDSPQFIEAHRLSAFNPRSNDVNVVLDLMIHDIDIILDLVDSAIKRIDACGISVLTGDTDIANARIEFETGCVANVTASRVSTRTERKMRMFCHQSYISLDYQNHTLTQRKIGQGTQIDGIPEIETESSSYEDGDALLMEVTHFLECIRNKCEPLVTGRAGRRALETAIRITDMLNQQSQSNSK
ncbi:MAG TPA: Gfo/Idh/MocA family oxidoreductase [Crenotrichaceae bacterium]|nr:Gfo/Idh/MocA family oxidoreductase [Crenotrichaceae bacterium]